MMKKYFLGIFVIFCLGTALIAYAQEPLKDGLDLLKVRNDNAALVIFEKILVEQPQSLDALWGKAEVLRRQHKYNAAETIFKEILKKNPRHAASLISLAYLEYIEDRLNDGEKLLKEALAVSSLDKENQAMAYTILGAINGRRANRGWFFNKIIYGTQIKYYFLKAQELSPGLPEVHLGLGTFYLLAPAIAGGNLDKAIQELELAIKIAPGFATPYARLAQTYKKKGDLKKYNFYLKRVKELDPENEALNEEPRD